MYNNNDRFTSNFYIGKSNIHGNGVIAKKYIPKNYIIGVAINYKYVFPNQIPNFIPHANSIYNNSVGLMNNYIGNVVPNITNDMGIYVNHCPNPNSDLHYCNNIYYLVAIKDIHLGEEISANYASKNVPWFIEGPQSWYK